MAETVLVERKGPRNIVNELNGKEWMLFTKSWFALSPAKRTSKLMHPASFPEEIPQSFITFFTKKNQWVLDPFAGTGTTLTVSRRLGRNSIGVELYQKYLTVAGDQLNQEETKLGAKTVMVVGDARKLRDIFECYGLPEVDFCITSPPYWNQLQLKHRRQRIRAKSGLATRYGASGNDLGNINDYRTFLAEQSKVFDAVFDIMKPGAHLVVVTNNVYKEKKLWPLAFDTFQCLSRRWEPRDEKIWIQNDRSLYPFGIFRDWVANRSHHYCLVFRKPKN